MLKIFYKNPITNLPKTRKNERGYGKAIQNKPTKQQKLSNNGNRKIKLNILMFYKHFNYLCEAIMQT